MTELGANAPKWESVHKWLQKLRDCPPKHNFTPLSKDGLREAIDTALSPLTEEALQAVATMPGECYPKIGFVSAYTTITAPIEWLALFLGRGSDVTWVSSDAHPGLSMWIVEHAGGLPLTRVTRWESLKDCDAVVVFGDNVLTRRMQPFLKDGVHLHQHGASWSGVWVSGRQPLPPAPQLPESLQDTWGRIAADCALHDGRGCLSPHVIFTDLPLNEALDGMADGMARAEALWPRGTIYPAEAAFENAREALAQVVGGVRIGDAWSVHGVPPQHAGHQGAPRSPLVVRVENITEATKLAQTWSDNLVVMGTDDSDTTDLWLQAGATRVVELGTMQRPPLDRINRDGRWVERTFQ